MPRRGAVAACVPVTGRYYQRAGFLPEALLNYLGRMGYIGRLLDESASRSAVVVEIAGSYVLRVEATSRLSPDKAVGAS